MNKRLFSWFLERYTEQLHRQVQQQAWTAARYDPVRLPWY